MSLKSVSALVLLGFVSTAFAAIPFSDRAGSFSGDGEWSGWLGGSGKLTVTSTIAVNRDSNGKVESIAVASQYHILGMPMGDAYVIRNERRGYFDLFGKNGKKRGNGYCLGNHCHIVMPADKLEETILFEADGCLSRFGSKTEYGSLWNWNERLCPLQF